MRPGELVLVDAGVEVDSLYTADVTRTIPVDGRFTAPQRRVYEAVLEAADATFVRAGESGVRFRDLHSAAMEVLARRLHEWGLLPEGVSAEDSLSPEGQYHRRWMVHGTSHHLGLDVHDCAQARREMSMDALLVPGMVFTIEPGLYFRDDDLLVPAELRGMGVRIEDDVVIHPDGRPERYFTPRFIVITKRDKDEFDFYKTFEELKGKFGDALIPLSWPLSAEIDEDLKEAIASADDELMEKYFEGEEFTDEEIRKGLVKGISEGAIVPVCSSAFELGHGVEGLLDLLLTYVPTPLQHGPYKGFNNANEHVERLCLTDAPMSAFVFKTIVDPFVGKISIMKVVTGKMESGTEVYNERAGKSEKLGKLFFMRGKEQTELNYAEAGDIVAVAKLQYTQSGDTLCDKSDIIRYLPLDYPSPTYFVAIEPEDKGDEEKMGSGLNKLREEDPSFVVERNPETHQTLLGGQGDMQLTIIMAKLKDRFGVSVKTVPQKIAYRETIKGSSDVQGKHKKQSGGAGQYGDVHIRFSPSQEEGLEFGEELFGGSVPKNYVPAVEKGLLECMEKGPLAGCKCVNVKAVLYDGSYHDVDSNEVSFKLAAGIAFRKGMAEANPCLLKIWRPIPKRTKAPHTASMNGMACMTRLMAPACTDGPPYMCRRYVRVHDWIKSTGLRQRRRYRFGYSV